MDLNTAKTQYNIVYHAEDKKQEDEIKTQTSDRSRTCGWEPGALGLMLSALVRGWNVV